MKKMLCLAVLATAFISAPALAGGGGKGLNVGANVLTGKGGVLGGLLGGGCGCGH